MPFLQSWQFILSSRLFIVFVLVFFGVVSLGVCCVKLHLKCGGAYCTLCNFVWHIQTAKCHSCALCWGVQHGNTSTRSTVVGMHACMRLLGVVLCCAETSCGWPSKHSNELACGSRFLSSGNMLCSTACCYMHSHAS